jgi:hypothetical protein
LKSAAFRLLHLQFELTLLCRLAEMMASCLRQRLLGVGTMPDMTLDASGMEQHYLRLGAQFLPKKSRMRFSERRVRDALRHNQRAVLCS